MEGPLPSQHMTTQQEFEPPEPLELTAAHRALTSSPTLAINEAVARRRAEGKTTIHLGFGEALFPLHPRLRQALATAAASTGYAPVAGILPLRQAIAGYIQRARGVPCIAEQVIVGPGSKPLLYALFHALDGDVMVPRPSWVSYAPQARLAGRQVFPVATDPVDHHRLTPVALDAALRAAHNANANPRILIINSPSNPTGVMFAEEDILALTGWARAHGITIISDEIYAETAHGWRAHISPARFYPEGCILTGGLSKAFSAGGWRLGYAILPASEAGTNLGRIVRALASEIWSAAASPIQEAAIIAFTPNANIEDYVRRAARLHGIVTHALYTTLNELGIACPRPAGAFYLYPDFAPWRAKLAQLGVTTSTELATYLLDQWEIATLPGMAFGEEPGALRLRLATSMLYNQDDVSSPEEREARLWCLLNLANPDAGDNSTTQFDLPGLVRAQERWRTISSFFNRVEKAVSNTQGKHYHERNERDLDRRSH